MAGTAPSATDAEPAPEPGAREGAAGQGSGLEAPALQGIRRLTALDTVRARIALAIDLGLLAPGERLPGNGEIATALDVGDMTVRRALESLCEDGVLVRRRGRAGGTLVADHPPRAVVDVGAYRDDAERVHALIDQRLVLESGLVQLAVTAITSERLAALDTLVGRMDAAQHWAQFHAADMAFHRGLADGADRPGAARLFVDVLSDLYAYFLPYPVEYLRGSNAEHRELLRAVRAGDAPAAVAVCCRHVDVLHRSMFMSLTSPQDDVT
jgi:DNA-binding FadR family transcriptional regulator